LVSSFFELLYSLILRQGDEDRICWIPFKRRKFEVRLYYHVVSILTSSSFFFFLISQNILKKCKRGATYSTQDVYKGKPRREKKDEKENPES
jgi:hypothetical protein